MKRAICTGILAVTAILLIAMGILVTLFFSQLVDSYIYKELVLREGGETYEMWRKPPVTPQTKVYFFNLTNPREFLNGEKPRFREIGPYVYDEIWEKINIKWNDNGTLSYEPSKKFFFNREASAGDESDIVQTINVPLMTAASHMKYAGKLVRLALSSMLNVFNQDAFAVHTVKEYLWGYDNPLVKLGKDVMPPEQVLPFDQFGFFVGRNGSTEGVFTAYTGKDSMQKYATITNWNGLKKLNYWKTDACNQLNGTDGTAFPPDITRNTTLYLFNPELCRSIPLVYQKDVIRNGLEGYRFGPPKNTFDSIEQNPDNDCFCPVGPPCTPQGLFNISICKFGSPIAMSWPHFLHGDPQLLQDVEGLKPNPSHHEFFIDMQPKMGLGMSAKARLQVNFMMSAIEDIKQIVGIRDIVFPLIWFESGIDSLPDQVNDRLKMATQMPEVARAGISYSLFGLGGILLFCVGLLLWKRMRSKTYGAGAVRNVQVEFEKRSSDVVVRDHKPAGNEYTPTNSPVRV